MGNDILMDVQHLSHIFRLNRKVEVHAVDDVSFQIKKGEIYGLVGESGSGKSVTAYSLMGLTAHPGKLIGGTLQFNGHEIEDMSEKELSLIHI